MPSPPDLRADMRQDRVPDGPAVRRPVRRPAPRQPDRRRPGRTRAGADRRHLSRPEPRPGLGPRHRRHLLGPRRLPGRVVRQVLHHRQRPRRRRQDRPARVLRRDQPLHPRLLLLRAARRALPPLQPRRHAPHACPRPHLPGPRRRPGHVVTPAPAGHRVFCRTGRGGSGRLSRSCSCGLRARSRLSSGCAARRGRHASWRCARTSGCRSRRQGPP
jgi:hypothetical protein